jgi:hypothetical protein
MANEVSPSIAKRWTPTLIKGGFTPVSTYFIDNYHRLAPTLSSLEAMLVIHLMRYKWDERHPHPTFATLSKKMGVTPTATRNHARSLEKKRFLNRLATQGSPNEFDLKPLFDALERLYLADEQHGKRGPQVNDEPLAQEVQDNSAETTQRPGRAIELN